MMTNPASTMMVCSVCGLDGGPFQAAEAALHVATHDRFHHAGAPTAVALTSVSRAEHPAAA